MKTKRPNGRKQYTISLPKTVGQLLEVQQNKKIYFCPTKNPNVFVISTFATKENIVEHKIFPNGKLNYFTLPLKLLNPIPDEEINNAIFNIDFEKVEKQTQRRGIITLNIE